MEQTGLEVAHNFLFEDTRIISDKAPEVVNQLREHPKHRTRYKHLPEVLEHEIEKGYTREKTQIYLDETKHELELKKHYAHVYRTLAQEPVLQENPPGACRSRPVSSWLGLEPRREVSLYKNLFLYHIANGKLRYGAAYTKTSARSATFMASTSIEVLPQGQYPNKPCPMLAMSNTDTELQTLHDFINTDIYISELGSG